MIELTEKQTETLEFLIEFHLEKNRSPTYKEIADEFSLLSRKAAYDRVQILKRKGYVSTGTTAKGIKTIFINEGEQNIEQ